MILPEIDPIALQIGPLAIRWYSLTWIAAFFTIYYLLQKSKDNLDAKKIEDITNKYKEYQSPMPTEDILYEKFIYSIIYFIFFIVSRNCF